MPRDMDASDTRPLQSQNAIDYGRPSTFGLGHLIRAEGPLKANPVRGRNGMIGRHVGNRGLANPAGD